MNYVEKLKVLKKAIARIANMLNDSLDSEDIHAEVEIIIEELKELENVLGTDELWASLGKKVGKQYDI